MRNHYGVNRDDLGYREHSMTLDEAQRIFPVDFVQQLNEILCNGNFGDSVMNPELLDILSWMKNINPKLRIKVTTNGGARDAAFWCALAGITESVIFSIDGLEDTNHYYRQDVSWKQLMKNVKNFIDAGGNAEWKTVIFDHNQHQIDTMRQLSRDLGFMSFVATDHGRNSGPAFDRNKKFVRAIGNWQGVTDYVFLEGKLKQHLQGLIPADLPRCAVPPSVSCGVQKDGSIYVNAVGEVYPCCFFGFATGELDGRLSEKLRDVRERMYNYNALERPLRECIEWFQTVPEAWVQPDRARGRIYICDSTCGTADPLKRLNEEVSQ
jgi:MoaA/NifB/PqqE/SkfB family radical SAM enzyme